MLVLFIRIQLCGGSLVMTRQTTADAILVDSHTHPLQ